MSIEYLSNVGNRLVKRCDTRNPFEIAENLGIKIMMVDDFKRLKGLYRIIKRNRWIFLNSNLDTRTQEIVCAHEIGHDQLHRSLAKGDGLMEFMLYDMRSRPEYEANIVAAEILLPDDDVLELIYDYGYDVEQIACQLKSDINLVNMKTEILRYKGYDLRQGEFRSNFLK